MASLRSSAKTAKLASALHLLRAGPNARALPPIVQSLTVRQEGVKGNGAARHWAKLVLPAIRFSNPAVQLSVEDVKKAEAEGEEPWTQTPGVTVAFNDPSLQPAFFPLTQQEAEKLVTKFWATFGEEATLRAFAEGKTVEPVQVEAQAEQQEPAAASAEAVEADTKAAA
ncbi:hypothetical protein JCM10213_000308 [Rhodosporidiobolus nylandii]